MDDGFIVFKTETEHFKKLGDILSRLYVILIIFKWNKYYFGWRNLEVLGNRVSEGWLQASFWQVEYNNSLNQSSNVTELLRSLGLVNYFQHLFQTLRTVIDHCMKF